MYDFNLSIQEISDYIADMAEVAGEAYFPTEEEMEEMARYYVEENEKNQKRGLTKPLLSIIIK